MDSSNSPQDDFSNLMAADTDMHVSGDLLVELQAQTVLQPWESPTLYPYRPLPGEYGYLRGQRRVRCSEKKLRLACRRREVSAVWTPDTAYLVAPIEVASLEPLVRNRLRATLLLLATLFVLFGLYFLWVVFSVEYDPGARGQFLDDSALGSFVLLGVLGLGFLYTYWLHRRRRTEPVADAARRARYKYWVRSGANVATKSIVVGIIVIFVISLINLPYAILNAGLVKYAVREGQVWRLLTGGLLHLNLFHLALNAVVLVSIGREVERVTTSSVLALVLLASVLGGSIASTLLLEQTSAGISGGIFGLIGFLTIFRWRARSVLPKGLFLNIMVIVILLSADTIFDQIAGMRIIDFAGHFGGLLIGVILSLLLLPRQIERVPVLPKAGVERLGNQAWFILIIGTILTCAIIIVPMLR